MAKLLYSAIASLDGYIADENGNFDWAAPDAEVHAFINDLERPIGTYLYGRRMYEVMQVWEQMGLTPASAVESDVGTTDEDAIERDFAQLWRAADKVVYSSSLVGVPTPRTRIERVFDAAKVREMKARAARDISIGGPTLAAHAFRAGLVDEYHLFVVPFVVGGGNPALPGGIRFKLELQGERRFAGGAVYLRYNVAR